MTRAAALGTFGSVATNPASEQWKRGNAFALEVWGMRPFAGLKVFSYARRLLVATAALSLVAAMQAAPALAAKPPAHRSGGLSGTVLNHLGNGLGGAKVTAYALPGLQPGCVQAALSWKPTASTTSTATGGFSLALAPGTYRIGVVPANLSTDSFGYWVQSIQGDFSDVTSWVGYADDILVPTTGKQGLTVRLTTPVTATGKVVDGINSPVSGLVVRLTPEEYGWQATNTPSAVTNGNGVYSIPGLPKNVPDHPVYTAPGFTGQPVNGAARYGFVITDPAAWHTPWLWWLAQYQPDNAIWPDVIDVTDSSTWDMTASPVFLSRTGRVNGKVVDQRGRALANISVSVVYAFGNFPVQTDARGRFMLPVQPAWPGISPLPLQFIDPAGRYQSAFYPGVEYESQATAVGPVDAGQEMTLTMKMVSGAATLTGHAWYSVGVPAAGATVSAYDPAGYTNPTRIAGVPGTVACDGSFSVTGLWPGAYKVAFAPGNSGPTQSSLANVSSGQTLSLGTVQMPSWVISGVVQEGSQASPGPAVGGIQVDAVVTGLSVNGQPVPGQAAALADYGMPSARAFSSEGGAGLQTGRFELFLTYAPWGMGGLYLTFEDPQGRFPDQVYRDYPAQGFGGLVDLWGNPQYQQQFNPTTGTGPNLFDIYLHRAFIQYATSAPDQVTVHYSDPVYCAGGTTAVTQWAVQTGGGPVHPVSYSCNGSQDVVLTFAAGTLPGPGSQLTYNWDGTSIWDGVAGDGLSWAPGWLPPGSYFGVRTPDWTTLDQPVITGVSISNAAQLLVTFSQDITCTTSPSGADLQQWNAMFFQNGPSQNLMPSSYDCTGGPNQIGLNFPQSFPSGSGQLQFNSNGSVASTTTPAVPARWQTVPIPS